MRILVLSNLYPPHKIGGYEVRCQQVCDLLRSFGHELRVLTSDHRVPQIETEEEAHVGRRLKIHGFYGHPWLPIHRLYPQEHENQKILREEIQEFQPEVVHVWNMGGLSKALLLALEAGDIPVQYDISDHWIARSLRGDVWLSWWNDEGSAGRKFLRTLLQTTGLRSLLSKQVPTASWDRLQWKRIYFCSAFMRELTASKGWPVEHAEVIYCGVETGKFSEKADWSRFERLLFVGRLNQDKDPLTAVRALALARKTRPELQLHLYGGGEPAYLDTLQQEAEKLGVADAIELKSVSAHEMRHVYSDYDALLFTSNWGEPFALTPLEAMASGLPVVLCPDGGDAELGRDGENCLLATAGEPSSVAQGILRLAESEALREQLALHALEEVRRLYDLTPIARQIEAALQQTASSS
ncbi:MAG: glycosyltransferase family 4 protein [Verrucomicrobiota bacterium]